MTSNGVTILDHPSVAESLIASYEPWVTPDAVDYLTAIGAMFGEVEMYVVATADDEGWTLILDVDRCPETALAWLAQWVGERLPRGIAEAMAREWITDAPNQIRGTVSSIARAAQRSMTGDRHVVIEERHAPGSAADAEDDITVITYNDETPNPAQVERDLLTVVPADIVLHYSAVDGELWGFLIEDDPTRIWDDIKTDYATWRDVKLDRTHGLTTGEVFARPRP